MLAVFRTLAGLCFSAGVCLSSSAFATTAAVKLPIEVIGPDGHFEAVVITVADPVGIDRLYLEIHRPAYRDAGVETGRIRGPKASLRINGRDWRGLTNDAVSCFEHEAAYGCLNGAYHTLRLTLPISDIRAGENTVEFRFNGTDKITSGYRVLDLDLLRNGSEPVLAAALFEYDDPDEWRPPIDGQDAIDAGRELWHNAELDEFPGGPEQRATCSSCHADDGRDLEYFAYSNWSIIERAKFHGLTAREGRQIASYIRANDAERHGRPWNPPYQPGPGLDGKPVDEWAAGAGVDAVLEEDAGMLAHLFPNGVSKQAIAPDGMMNVREQPIAIQLPDWNAWLTNDHPVDVWGDFFLETGTVDGSDGTWRDDTLGHLLEARAAIEDEGVDALIAQGQLKRLLGRFSRSPYYFLRDIFGGGVDNLPSGMHTETAALGVRKWAFVKLWALQQRHDLSARARDVYGDATGEPRSWIAGGRTVFDLAPHISADCCGRFQYQPLLAGKYESTAWYHLQFLVQSGNGETGAINPVDWNYHPGHINGLNKGHVNGPAHPLRQTQAFAKMLQQYSRGRDLDRFYVRQIHPGRYGPNGKNSRPFDNMTDASLRADLYQALLGALMDKIDSHTLDEWQAKRQADLAAGRDRLKPADHVPVIIDDASLGAALHRGRWVDGWYTVVPRFRAAGVEEPVLERMIAWGEQMWPEGDWDAIRDDDYLFSDHFE